MNKPHLKEPTCYSNRVTVSPRGGENVFHCGYCNRSWSKPLGITGTFENGRLVAATYAGGIPVSESVLIRRRKNAPKP